MRTLYIVTYDIIDPKRLIKVFKLMKGYGDHLQLSVFRCELSNKERIELITKLSPQIKHNEDQVLFFPIGPAGGQKEDNVISLGLTYQPANKSALVF